MKIKYLALNFLLLFSFVPKDSSFWLYLLIPEYGLRSDQQPSHREPLSLQIPGAVGLDTCSDHSSACPGWAPSSEVGCAAGLAVAGSACPAVCMPRAGFNWDSRVISRAGQLISLFPCFPCISSRKCIQEYSLSMGNFLPLNCCSS